MDKHSIFETDEHVLHMWEPLNFETGIGYDYLRNGALDRLGEFLLKGFAFVVLSVYNRLAFGFSVEGRENLKKLGKSGAVTICNHIHPMDCTMVNFAVRWRRMYYITLERNFKIPLVRHIIRILGAVPLPNSYSCAAEMFSAMGEAVKNSSCVQIYPEAVMSPYHKGLRTFRNGAFQLAFDNGAPVLPMVIKQVSTHGIYFYKKKPCLKLVVLPPVFPDTSLSRREAVEKLKNECRTAMETALEV